MDYKTLFSQTKDLTLLLVEDYAPLRQDMAEVLEDFFKEVVVAQSATDALEIYQEYYKDHQTYFDLVISDIEMPVMNGVEFSRVLRELNKDQQIIIISAHTDSDYLLPLINMGVAQFITKPLKHDQFLNVLFTVSKKCLTKEIEKTETSLIDLGEGHIWDKEKLVLKQGDRVISLTKHELMLMELMISQIEQVCSNEKIMHYFYSKDIDIGEKNIRNQVFKLRKKLPEKMISSTYGMGYKLMPIR